MDIVVIEAASAHQQNRTISERKSERKLPLARRVAQKLPTNNPPAGPFRVSIDCTCFTALNFCQEKETKKEIRNNKTVSNHCKFWNFKTVRKDHFGAHNPVCEHLKAVVRHANSLWFLCLDKSLPVWVWHGGKLQSWSAFTFLQSKIPENLEYGNSETSWPSSLFWNAYSSVTLSWRINIELIVLFMKMKQKKRKRPKTHYKQGLNIPLSTKKHLVLLHFNRLRQFFINLFLIEY